MVSYCRFLFFRPWQTSTLLFLFTGCTAWWVMLEIPELDQQRQKRDPPNQTPANSTPSLASWYPPSSPCSVLCSFFAQVSKNDGKRQRLMIRDFLKYPPSVWLLYIIHSDTLYVDFAGFVVGHAGLLHGLLMLFVAYFIISLTILSICAISTNGAVEGGGAYCILNQSLCHIEC